MSKIHKLELQDNSLEFEINKEKFYINTTNAETLDSILSIAESYEEIQKKEIKPEQVPDLLREIPKWIDKLLGEGSVKKIFKDRPVDFVNITAILDLLMTALYDDMKKIDDKYSLDRIKNE